MQIGRMKDEEEASKFVEDRLLKVKELLDEIADQSGLVYICLDSQYVEMFGKVGNALLGGLVSVMRVVPDRLELACKAQEFAYVANKKAEEEEKHKPGDQGDLFSGAENAEGGSK